MSYLYVKIEQITFISHCTLVSQKNGLILHSIPIIDPTQKRQGKWICCYEVFFLNEAISLVLRFIHVGAKFLLAWRGQYMTNIMLSAQVLTQKYSLSCVCPVQMWRTSERKVICYKQVLQYITRKYSHDNTIVWNTLTANRMVCYLR